MSFKDRMPTAEEQLQEDMDIIIELGVSTDQEPE